MYTERLNNADQLSAAVPAGTKSGDPVIILGDVPGVAATDRGAGGNLSTRATVWTQGVFSINVTEAVSTEGTKIFLTSTGTPTTTASGNTLFGRTVHSAEGRGGTKPSGTGDVQVLVGGA